MSEDQYAAAAAVELAQVRASLNEAVRRNESLTKELTVARREVDSEKQRVQQVQQESQRQLRTSETTQQQLQSDLRKSEAKAKQLQQIQISLQSQLHSVMQERQQEQREWSGKKSELEHRIYRLETQKATVVNDLRQALHGYRGVLDVSPFQPQQVCLCCHCHLFSCVMSESWRISHAFFAIAPRTHVAQKGSVVSGGPGSSSSSAAAATVGAAAAQPSAARLKAPHLPPPVPPEAASAVSLCFDTRTLSFLAEQSVLDDLNRIARQLESEQASSSFSCVRGARRLPLLQFIAQDEKASNQRASVGSRVALVIACHRVDFRMIDTERRTVLDAAQALHVGGESRDLGIRLCPAW